MAKRFTGILFSFFLLLFTSTMAEEESVPTETDMSIEIPEEQENEVSEERKFTDEENDEQNIQEEVTEEPQETEPQEELSEAQKEALEAEAAELRELGMEEEPIYE